VKHALAVVLLTLLAAACGQRSASFQGSDVTGSSFGRDFQLADPSGHNRTLADYRG
jgi:protein SCO1/2